MPPLESITTMTLHPAQVSWTRRINQTAPEPPVSTKNLCIYSSVQGQAVRAENCHHHTWAHTTSQSCGYAAPPLLRTAPWVESFLPLGQWKIPLKKKKKQNLSLPASFWGFQKVQLNFTNSGGFWPVCVSQSPNFWLLNEALTQVIEVSLSLATIFAFVFVLLSASSTAAKQPDPATGTCVRRAKILLSK